MFIAKKNSVPKHLITKCGIVTKVNEFKYLGEVIQPNATDKEAKMARSRKMYIAFHVTGITRNLCLPMPLSDIITL